MRRPLSEIIDSAPARITGRQLRAARIMAGKTRKQLADDAGLSEVTVIAHEQRGDEPITAQLQTRLSLIEALHQAGVRLTDSGAERIAP